jgi:hypothetical protein
MKVTTLFKYGFEYKGVVYGWKDKKLYRLPYTKNKRSYNILEIPFYCYKSTLVANIQRTKLTMNRIKSLTKEINIELDSYVFSDMPF